MHFLLMYDYVEDILEQRTPFRKEHLKNAQAAYERGELLMAGAMTDPIDGAIFVFETDEIEVVNAFVKSDPYVKNGLVTRWRVRPWQVVVGAR
jgi:uncharacterized protein YciI